MVYRMIQVGTGGMGSGWCRHILPPFVASVLDVRYLASVRSGTAGQAGGPVFTPGGAAGFGGGGGERIIIRSGP